MSWSYRFSEVGAALALEAAKRRAGPQAPEVSSLFCSQRAGGQFVPIWKWRVRCEPYEAPDFRESHLSLEYNNWRGSNCQLRPSTAGSRMCLWRWMQRKFDRAGTLANSNMITFWVVKWWYSNSVISGVFFIHKSENFYRMKLSSNLMTGFI